MGIHLQCKDDVCHTQTFANEFFLRVPLFQLCHSSFSWNGYASNVAVIANISLSHAKMSSCLRLDHFCFHHAAVRFNAYHTTNCVDANFLILMVWTLNTAPSTIILLCYDNPLQDSYIWALQYSDKAPIHLILVSWGSQYFRRCLDWSISLWFRIPQVATALKACSLDSLAYLCT